MSMTKLKVVRAMLAGARVPLALGLLTIATGAMAYQNLGEQPKEPRQEEKPQPAARGGNQVQARTVRPTPQLLPKRGERVDGNQVQFRTDRHGDPLPAEARARLGTVRLRHGGYIGFLAFTPDGKHLVSQGQDGVRVWDTVTGKGERHLPVEANGSINPGNAGLSPDGRVVITMEYRVEKGEQLVFICLRGRADLKLLRKFPVGKGLYSFRLSPDGKVCVLDGGDGSTVEVWDVAAGRQLRSWKCHKGQVWGHTFSADGKTLVTGGEDKTLRFWDVATGGKKREIHCANMIGRVALSGDGKLVAFSIMDEVKGTDGRGNTFAVGNRVSDRVSVREVASGKEVRQLSMPPTKFLMGGRGAQIRLLTFAPDGKTLVTGQTNGMVRFWVPSTGKQLYHYFFGYNGAATLAFAPDGKMLAVASATAIRFIDAAALSAKSYGKDLLARPGHRHGVIATDITPDGRTVATADGFGAIRLWDPATGRERARLDVRDSSVAANRLQIVGDGRQLLAAYTDKTLRMWDLATHKEQRRFDTSRWGLGWLAVSADGKTVVLAQTDNTVSLVDVASGKVIRTLEGLEDGGQGAAFTRDGRTLALWCGDHTVQVRDLGAGKKLRQFARAGADMKSSFYVAAISPDGRLIAYGSQQRYLVMHDLATGKEVRRLENLPDGVSVIAFTPDSKTLAWGGWRDPIIHLVEVATGQERHHLIGHEGHVQSLTFSADSKKLLSGNDDTTALVWDLTGKLGAKGKWGGSLSAADLTACWNDLGGADAARAYQTIRKLAAAPATAIPFLGKQLQPLISVDEKRLARLIADLDSNKYAVRKKAAKELANELDKLGEAAVGPCRKALEGAPSAEVRRQLEPLLEKQAKELWVSSPQRLQTLRTLEVLELAGTAQARQVLGALAKGAAGASLSRDAQAALERLDRRN